MRLASAIFIMDSSGSFDQGAGVSFTTLLSAAASRMEAGDDRAERSVRRIGRGVQGFTENWDFVETSIIFYI